MPKTTITTHIPGECRLDGCTRPVNCRGWCKTHYEQTRLGKEPHLTISRTKHRGTCKVDGCGRPHNAKGFCKTHYNQQRTGRPVHRKHSVISATVPLADVLEEFAERDEETGCLVWQRSVNGSGEGYGEIRGERVHRIAYRLANGEIPDNKVVDHICHNTRCIEVTHLRAVTLTENNQNLRISKRNTSGMRGVWFDQRQGRWVAGIMAEGKRMQGGSFHDFEDACDAVIALRAKHYKYAEEEFYRAA